MSKLIIPTPDATTTATGKIELAGSLGGTATSPTVVTNANLTGPVTSVGNATTIAAGVVTNAMLSTTTGEPGGAWSTWSPTYTNLTVGNGTVISKYLQVGKLVSILFSFTWGSTSAFTAASNIDITIPITASSDHITFSSFGNATFQTTAAGTVATGIVVLSSTTKMRPYAINASATYAAVAQVNNTTPITWATGSNLFIFGSYVAA